MTETSTPPAKTIEEMRAVLERIAPRYRVSSAIGQVCGIGEKSYGPMVNLFNYLKDHPERAADTAAWVAQEFSFEACTLQARLLSQILAVVDGFDHTDEYLGDPAEQLAAVRLYHDTMLAILTGTPLPEGSPA